MPLLCLLYAQREYIIMPLLCLLSAVLEPEPDCGLCSCLSDWLG